ncbi:cell division protein SepF [Enterococcus sp. BWB1-3]|uniref:cell division protein SepF n=1 Tax=unclassified Enterococcus TaxID=2608891 RepID=UPI001924A720|nr:MULTISPECIES: cell division protein SepF [unclassified Enterococcus]MBL1227869.1 cell division protein SepF [Enterococcus sp. BWB1-3]MCB5953131.1 cell division protein SepF [Enterococcus sp. BWT-B8]MCB5956159.1 cell division protein SepF [Enterococcus sp. CWB-B31]
MSIFNKNALSNFFGLSSEDEYDNYDSYVEKSAVNEQPRQPRQQPRQQQAVPQQQTAQRQDYYRSSSEPLSGKPSARYRSTEEASNPNNGNRHQTRSYNEKKVVSMRNSSNSANSQEFNHSGKPVKISIIEPRVYSEAMNIAKHIIVDEAVLVNFHLVEESQARRIVDFLTGAVYALDGDIQRVGDEIFLCTPSNMEIDSATAQSLAKKQMFDF